MVQVLKKKPSFAQSFGSGVGEGVSSSVEKAAEIALKRREQLNKNLNDLPNYFSKRLKSTGRGSYVDDREAMDSLLSKAAEKVKQGAEMHEAYEEAFKEHEGERKQSSSNKGSFADNFLKKFAGPLELPWDVSEENRPRRTRSEEYPHGIASSIAKHPKESLAHVPFSLLGGLESLDSMGGPLSAKSLANKLLGRKDAQSQNPTEMTDALAEKTGFKKMMDALPDEAKENMDISSLIASFINPAGIARGASPFMKGLSNIFRGNRGASQAEQLAPKLLGYSGKAGADGAGIARAAEEVGASERSLAGRVHRQPQTATEMRIARAKPKSKMHQTPKQIEIREAQVKNFPKYVEEIEADAAKRAMQAEARIPKTDKGRMSQQVRMHEAKKAFEPARESYQKSLSRVRELERQMAKRPAVQRQEMQEILSMAKEELKEAEFAFKQATENLKGINYRATIPEMREAANKKILGIQDAIAAGEEYKLAKMDYSPDLIKEAKRISKNKPLPRVREGDFYNSVHENYAKEYRNRLGAIDKELAALKKQTPNMGSVQKAHQLQQEKDILSKMVESADAEQTIHRHKFGLREMAERKKGAERMATFERVQGSPKVKAAAEEKMWKRRIEDVKTTEGREKLAKEIAEDAGQPDKSSQFRKALDEVDAKAKDMKEGLKSKPSTPKQARNRASQIAKEFKEMVDGFRKGIIPGLKTKMAIDISTGLATALWDDFRKEADIPLSSGAVGAAAFGRMQGAGTRVLTNQLTKWFLSEVHIRSAEDAYRKHDNEKLSKFSPSIKKKARERAFGD